MADLETGRTIARLEAPDMITVGYATCSPDGSRVATIVGDDGPAIHVWDLRSIRRQLAAMGLDWEAPAFSGSDPAEAGLPHLPPLQVDFGSLICGLEHSSEPPKTLIGRLSARLKENPDDVDAYHQRGHAFHQLGPLPRRLPTSPPPSAFDWATFTCNDFWHFCATTQLGNS